jgi:transcriptional regulator with XRE-family HTH domain
VSTVEAKTPFNKRLGKNIQRLRIRAGLTQAQVGERMFYTQQHICRVEQGGGGMPLPSLLRLTKVLDCAVDELLEGLDEYI